MARIYNLKIKNFRGIQAFDQTFGDARFICLIGRGDSGKTTILDAVYSVLYPNWNLAFHDNDFHNCDIKSPIEIEVSLFDLPVELLSENKFGLHIRGLDKETGLIVDELEDVHEKVLTIRLEVKRDLEPQWFVVNSRQEPTTISARDRERLSVCSVSDYVDRHFSWSRGNPLSTLLKQQEESGEQEEELPINDALREAKGQIDSYPFAQFEGVMEKVKIKAEGLGIDIANAKTTIDFRDISIKDGKVSLHEDRVPFRVKGKGSKRLISFAIQLSLIEGCGVLLIDEIEQGLEPDRVQHLVNHLKNKIDAQVFITTHSRDVVVELDATDLFVFRKGEKTLTRVDKDLQGCCRSNPEAFFAHKSVICEGPTEIGICRAINEQRVKLELPSAALKGVRFINGGGSQMFAYASKLNQAAFKVALFCDSDTDMKDLTVAQTKSTLRSAQVPVFDWEEGDCLEVAIFKDISFDAVLKCLKLVREGKVEEDSLSEEEAKAAIRDAIQNKYTLGKISFKREHDSAELRQAIGLAASKGKWYKNTTKAQALGKIMLEDIDTIREKKLGRELEALSNWIDNG